MTSKKSVYDETGSKERKDEQSILKKIMGGGVGALMQGEEGIKSLVSDFSLPKEFLKYLIATTDKAKGEIVKMITTEMRDYFSRLNLTEEAIKVLTSVSLEVKAEVRFKPVEKDHSALAVPKIKGKMSLKKND